MKVLLILFVIAVSASSIDAKATRYCQEKFNSFCGYDEVISIVKQGKCDETTLPLCPSASNLTECRKFCQDKFILNIDNYTSIAHRAFRSTNFSRITLKSESDICEQKTIKLAPQSFHNLASVRHLELDCVKFNATPNAFKLMESIEELLLSRTQMSDMPDSFFSEMRYLTKLMMSEVKIPALTPASLSEINEWLQELALVDNQLSEITGMSFARFSKLRKLHITHNPITEVHAYTFYGLNKLTSLRLVFNNISVLHQNAFVDLSELSHLDLSFNKIKEIKEEAFNHLPIKQLELSFNQLAILEAGAFMNMDNLQKLELNGNLLTTLAPKMFEGLEDNDLDLNLEHNRLQSILAATFNGFNLRTLNLKFNNLTVLETDIFNGLRIKKWLNLRSNGIEEIKAGAFKNLALDGVIFLGKYAVTAIDSYTRSESDSIKEIDLSGLKA